jgi:DNA-binding CsgD family transcriptional regulator
MSDGIVGREPELTATAALFHDLRDRPAVLMLEGEAGIGKTTVWAAAIARAPSDFRLLSCRPAATETGLAYSALGDLLEPVLDEVLPALREPQRRALAVALLREQPGQRRLDHRAVSAATLSVMRVLAASRPVLVAIDDVQWVDLASARVLEYVVRRLDDVPVGVLACERLGEPGPIQHLNFAAVLHSGGSTRVRIGPLGVDPLHDMLRNRLGRSLPRQTLARLESVTGGNPLFALEVARALRPGDSIATVLTRSGGLDRLVEARITTLPSRARRVLLIAAATPVPTVELLASATAGPRSEVNRALDEAVGAGVVNIDDSQVRFAHPLYAACAYASARPSERRAAHRRLAALASDVEERARHLALGAESADEQLAECLDEAAEQARRRGAPDVAAELAEHARRVTPSNRGAARRRRTVQAAEYQFHAGELNHARSMLEGVLAAGSTGPERADALRLLGEIRYHDESFAEAIPLFAEALASEGAVEVQLAIELNLCYCSTMTGDAAAGRIQAYRALALAERTDDQGLLAQALAAVTIVDLLTGRKVDDAKLERALRLEDHHRQAPIQVRPSVIAGYLAVFAGELARADQYLGSVRERIVEGGADNDLNFVSAYLIWSACWRGDLLEAERYAQEAIENAERLQAGVQWCWALGFGALPSAFRGDAALTSSRSHACREHVERTGFHIAALWAQWALAQLALGEDDPRGAHAALAPLLPEFDEYIPDPARAFFVPDAVEALIALGDLPRAEHLLDVFEEAARRQERRWALMICARCRALLLAERGLLEQASAAASGGVEIGADSELRIEVARTFLVAGQVARRQRHKRAAVDYLQEALDVFEPAGARLWTQRTRAELGRVGLRPAAPAGLTVSERRVAELAGSGRTNREVAAELFMSPKTVEAHLARIYRKLDVRSRAELGAWLERDAGTFLQT